MRRIASLAVLLPALVLPCAAGAASRPHHVLNHAHPVHRAHAVAHSTSHRAHESTVAHRRRRHSSRTIEPETTDTARTTIPALPLTRVRNLPPLKGSYESLVRQNERNEAEGLKRIPDDDALATLRREGELVPVPVSASLRINPELPVNRRLTRPWTARFLADLGRAHYARFRRSFQVNSAVRTVAYQRRLIEVNGNAAPADGDVASPHLTGATIDIGKRGMNISEIAWMRAYLFPLQTAGKIDVEEEFQQSCFHITVYKSYVPGAAPRPAPARRRHASSASLLAARMR
jgi:hypothetical protein